jgi:hypothetical protein
MRPQRARLAARARAGIVCALLALAGCGAGGGQPTPEAATAEYVSALAAGDAGRLARLADPEDASSGEIARRLRVLGGGRLRITHTEIHDTESDHTKSVTVQGLLTGAPYSADLWLYLRGDRWYVALGPSRNGHPKP